MQVENKKTYCARFYRKPPHRDDAGLLVEETITSDKHDDGDSDCWRKFSSAEQAALNFISFLPAKATFSVSRWETRLYGFPVTIIDVYVVDRTA